MDPLGLLSQIVGPVWDALRDRRHDRERAVRDAAEDRTARADLLGSVTALREVLDRTAGSADLDRGADPGSVIDHACTEVHASLDHARERGLLGDTERAAVVEVVAQARRAAGSLQTWHRRVDELDVSVAAAASGPGREAVAAEAERLVEAQLALDDADLRVRDTGRRTDDLLTALQAHEPGAAELRRMHGRWAMDRERTPPSPERVVLRREAGLPESVRLVPGGGHRIRELAEQRAHGAPVPKGRRHPMIDLTEVGTMDVEQAYRAYRDAVERERRLATGGSVAEHATARRETLVRKADLAQARERAERERRQPEPTSTPQARKDLVERLDRESARARAESDAAKARGDLAELARLRRERQVIDRQRAELGRGLPPPGRGR